MSKKNRKRKPNFDTMNYPARRKRAETGETTHQLNRIYERDQGICQLCNKPCKREDASRDHLVSPLHLPYNIANADTNVQLAHKMCNNKKEWKASAKQRTITNSDGKPHLSTKIGNLFPQLSELFMITNEPD